MVVEYKGRKITAIARRKDGFAGVLVRVNGTQVFHYGPMSSARLRTIDGAIEQTKREIDSVDAYTDDYDRPRFAQCWYRKTDPRYTRHETMSHLDTSSPAVPADPFAGIDENTEYDATRPAVS